LFDKGFRYSAINATRSAISYFHQPIEGFQIGKHPSVSKLLRGISRKRPQIPKYTFIWDIETVLQKMNSMPENEELPLSNLSFKVVALLGITNPKRGSELSKLYLNFMGKSDSTYAFHLTEPTKHFKQGKSNDPIEFREYKTNRKICPVATLDNYIARTKEFRERHNTSKLFVSYVNPHKPVSKDTLARWVSRMLDLSNIDTKTFKPHSKRAASSSKAAEREVAISDILNMGNWSNESVWQKFYNKNISATEKYQKEILGALN